MKKALAFLLALVMILGLIACSDSAAKPETNVSVADAPATEKNAENSPAEEQITLTFGTFETNNLTAELWDNIITAFEATYPNIRVEKILATGDDRTTFFKTMLASGSMPDITLADSAMYTLGIAAEIPEDLQQLFDPGILPSYDGIKCLFPAYASEAMQCYYNKDIFAEHGLKVPETYEDFINICDTLLASGVTPMMTGGAADVWATGEPWYTAVINPELEAEYGNFNEKLLAGEVKFENELLISLLEAWQYLVEKGYYYEGAMSMSHSQATAEFLNGNAAMFIDGAWGASSYDAQGITNIGCFRMPTPSGLNNRLPTVNGFLVYNESPNQEAAWKFCEFFVTNEETYRQFLAAEGYACPTKNQVTYEMGPVTTEYTANFADSEAIIHHIWVKGDYAWPSGMEAFMNKSMQNIFVGADVRTELACWDVELQTELENQ